MNICRMSSFSSLLDVISEANIVKKIVPSCKLEKIEALEILDRIF